MALTYAPFYDVEHSVGIGKPNSSRDVMLVQFFLFSISIDPNWPMSFPPAIPLGTTPEPIFPIDGVFEPGLADWINVFQQVANDNGLGPVLTDGIVSHGGAAWGRPNPRAGQWFTIHAMNHLLFHSDKGRFLNLGTDPALPPELQTALKLVVEIDPVP